MSGSRLNAAYYAAPIEEFLRAADDDVYAPPATWGTGLYSPTPTIIEAARSLYARRSGRT